MRDLQVNALVQDLRANSEEELGKERLQQLLFAGTPYGHPVLGTVAGLQAITLDDVKAFVAKACTQAALTVGVSGDAPAGLEARLGRAAAELAKGPALPAPAGVVARTPKGLAVDLIEKETRATTSSFGHPIAVTRSAPGLPRALPGPDGSASTARPPRAPLPAHPRAARDELRRLRLHRRPSPAAASSSSPSRTSRGGREDLRGVDPATVVPENGPMAFRIALWEVRKLVEKGLSRAEFETTRDYLMKNVFVMTATQDQQLGYARSTRSGTASRSARRSCAGTSRSSPSPMNAAIRKHLSSADLQVVMITRRTRRASRTSS
ncbi:MAG: hypothetical protein U0599_11835 [Vicinamibacteria bacterium]